MFLTYSLSLHLFAMELCSSNSSLSSSRVTSNSGSQNLNGCRYIINITFYISTTHSTVDFQDSYVGSSFVPRNSTFIKAVQGFRAQHSKVSRATLRGRKFSVVERATMKSGFVITIHYLPTALALQPQCVTVMERPTAFQS